MRRTVEDGSTSRAFHCNGTKSGSAVKGLWDVVSPNVCLWFVNIEVELTFLSIVHLGYFQTGCELERKMGLYPWGCYELRGKLRLGVEWVPHWAEQDWTEWVYV